jgi:hypothetical protein
MMEWRQHTRLKMPNAVKSGVYSQVSNRVKICCAGNWGVSASATLTMRSALTVIDT